MHLADFEGPHQGDFAWTVGTDANLLHCRMIDALLGSTGMYLVSIRLLTIKLLDFRTENVSSLGHNIFPN